MINIHYHTLVAACAGIAVDIRSGVIAAAGVLAIVISPAAGSDWLATSPPLAMSASAVMPAVQKMHARVAEFGANTPSPDVRHVANWVADSRDNSGADFVIIDKIHARVYVFDVDARLRASAAVLLGAARGDDSVPGIGLRPIAEVLPQERTTPAGRFIAERGHNTRGEDVVWVDYDAAVSMHRVLTTNLEERRLERLATPSVEDNRISYGCINVPVVFYESYIRPIFAARRAVVYVLPEVKPVRQVFGSYDIILAPGVVSRP